MNLQSIYAARLQPKILPITCEELPLCTTSRSLFIQNTRMALPIFLATVRHKFSSMKDSFNSLKAKLITVTHAFGNRCWNPNYGSLALFLASEFSFRRKSSNDNKATTYSANIRMNLSISSVAGTPSFENIPCTRSNSLDTDRDK